MKIVLEHLAVVILFLGINAVASAQCGEGETEITIEIVSDSWPGEMSWDLYYGDELLGEGESDGAIICLDESIEEPCLMFNMYDSYGDGVYAPGGYWVYVDGTLIATGNNYGFGESVAFLCAPGMTCNDALELTAEDYGTMTTLTSSTWYAFTPEVNGMYAFNSCGFGCDTRLWIYDYCNMGNFDVTNEGTIYYDDYEGGCEEEANLTVLLEGDVTYWVRWADLGGECATMDWNFEFIGPPTGCMDEEACNYNPLAEADSGDCIYAGDPLCTGPDLVVLKEAIENSLYVDYMDVSEDNCYIDEGCLNGFGERELIRFTTHIKNIGDIDYYIGPTSNNDSSLQFEWGDCHNHWHYEGYAEYVLFEMDGDVLPIGFKNGFCVMDLECGDGGTAQYGCSNMGISAHCGDIYSSGLSCQWIDVTGVPDGDYQLVVRVNWDENPDALGRYELTYDNNWALVCINMDRSGGDLAVTQFEDCPDYYDCMGDLFGLAQTDCNGDCNGSALMGDLDANDAQEYTDAVMYVEQILGNDIETLPCTDIDQDDEITVSDAALMSRCQFWNVAHEHPDSLGYHEKCDFPVVEIINPFDTVHLSIGNVNVDQGYLDVHVLNPNNKIVGYQFTMSGLNIQSVVSLADPIDYPIEPSFMPGGQEIIGLSYEGESLFKNYEWAPLLRIYWAQLTSDTLCIDFITDIVNADYQNTLHVIEDGCVMPNSISEAVAAAPMFYPNPMNDQAVLRFANPSRGWLTLTITDPQGRILRSEEVTGTRCVIDRRDLAVGAYLYTLTGPGIGDFTGRFNVR